MANETYSYSSEFKVEAVKNIVVNNANLSATARR
ncbi:hypothetical protein DFP82_107145 [Psychrobacter fozii]|uniref:Transposase n=1 Tax=Psychrobacter fozii TaxID=198480 RepID=A0A2V4UXJ2_9GAMM|nr:hypothetical protein DFP82_107145 [Psychrobacter fozii]